MIEIKPTGSYLEIDNEGYLINPASEDKLQDAWKPAIQDIVEVYKENYGESLKNVYLRGSVAKGKAIEYISDIDTFAFVNLPNDEIRNDWNKGFREKMKIKYPFIEGVELKAVSLKEEHTQNLMLNQALLVYGSRQSSQKVKFGDSLILHAYHINKRFEGTLKRLNEDRDNDEIKKECTWAMKGIVRMGLELVMERSGKYSRDLYPCYEVFSQYYPEKEAEMREVLHLALNPTSDRDIIRKVMNRLGKWLQKEIEKESK